MVFVKLLFIIIIIIPISLSTKCKNNNFNKILPNNQINFKINTKIESCYEYSLIPTKDKIVLIFSKGNSTSAEVLIYKSKSDISIKNNLYKNFYERFLIWENQFKEIDVKNFFENIYIIIRDPNLQKRKEYENNFILYDTEIPIPLKEGKPLTMKFFLSNNKYKFIYLSRSNLTFIYSTKIKSKKYINVTYDNQVIIEKQIDETDQIFNLKTENNEQKYLNLTIENFEEDKENQEFSIVIYEKDIFNFVEIEKYKIINLNYINLNKDDEKQIFYFYYNMENSTKSNSINFKLDPLAYKKQYINIASGIYHSSKELNQEEFKKYFNFEKNIFPIEYDLNSDEYKRIYFVDTDTSFSYRYIYFKIEISKLPNYYSPKNILISIWDEIEEIKLNNINYYQTTIINKEIKPYIPIYFKLKINKEENYIFYSPYPKNTMYIKGDLIVKVEQNIKINKEYFEDKNELFILSNISEFTLSILGSEPSNLTFYIEKFIKDDLSIRENIRNEEPINIKFEEEDCKLKRKKYLLGIYDKEIYTKLKNTYIKYWTSNDGEMNVYYKNNINLDGDSLFPFSDKYIKKKEDNFALKNYFDFFTFICSKPGTLSLRPAYKTFNETTYIIGQNTIKTINIDKNIVIIKLTAPKVAPAHFLHFAIYSVYGKKIRICPDTPELFNETIFEGDIIFKLKIDLYKYKEDQLAFKVNSTESTKIQVVEIIHYNFSEYTILKNSKMTHFTDNNFVKFINRNTKKIKIIIKGLYNIPFNYGLVKLFSDDIDYLPMAFFFRNTTFIQKPKDIEVIEINNTFYGKNNDDKKYLAFLFSIPRANYYEFDAQVIEEDLDENNGWKKEGNKYIIILIIIGIIIIISFLINVLIFFIIKKNNNKNKFEMDVEKMVNQPLNDENGY